MREFKQQKFVTVLKRKEAIEQDFQKKLDKKEELLQKRMIQTAEKRKKIEEESSNSRYYGNGGGETSTNSKILYSQAGDQQRQTRAKSAYRVNHNQHQSSDYFGTMHNQNDQDEEERLLVMLSDLQQRMQKAEFQKYNRLFETNIEKQHEHNENIVIKKQIKNQKAE